MCNELTDDRKAEIAFNTAVEARKLELQFFWKRSLFFWGFIAVTFAAYGQLHEKSPYLSAIAACFGLVCSVAWSLSNRGSKFWYESWETHVDSIEKQFTGQEVTGHGMFAGPKTSSSSEKDKEQEQKPHPCRKFFTWWWGGKRFSVSKLAIALSDYTVVVWCSLIVSEIYRMCKHYIFQEFPKKSIAVIVCFVLSVIYCFLMFKFSDSSDKKAKKRLEKLTDSSQ